MNEVNGSFEWPLNHLFTLLVENMDSLGDETLLCVVRQTHNSPGKIWTILCLKYNTIITSYLLYCCITELVD